jgi:hypothetical protein
MVGRSPWAARRSRLRRDAATAVAQMGLSLFYCRSAFLLILFIEPPARFFTD